MQHYQYFYERDNAALISDRNQSQGLPKPLSQFSSYIEPPCIFTWMDKMIQGIACSSECFQSRGFYET
jgi:hypothetical protein